MGTTAIYRHKGVDAFDDLINTLCRDFGKIHHIIKYPKKFNGDYWFFCLCDYKDLYYPLVVKWGYDSTRYWFKEFELQSGVFIYCHNKEYLTLAYNALIYFNSLNYLAKNWFKKCGHSADNSEQLNLF